MATVWHVLTLVSAGVAIPGIDGGSGPEKGSVYGSDSVSAAGCPLYGRAASVKMLD